MNTLTAKIFIERIADMYDTGDSIEMILMYIRDNISEVK